MCNATDEELYLQAIGRGVLDLVRTHRPNPLTTQDCTDSVLLLREIFSILEDDTLDDADCFYRIDAIVRAFQKAGVHTHRHWELD